MRTIQLGSGSLRVPTIAVGCMRINGLSEADAESFVNSALELGANFFDHADIYGGGQCEEVFAKAVHMSPTVREKLIIQSKCSIVPGKMYDFSKAHILSSVDSILKRLGTEYLDVLLLHRPDALMEPEEVAAAFSELERAGKVRNFGVSNQNPYQIQLLKSCVQQPLLVNQLQLSITNASMIAGGMHVNMMDADAVNRDGGVLDYCRLNGITIQPWSPFQYGFFEGVFIGSDKYPELNAVLSALAEQHSVTPTTIAMAWLLRHPARMQPVTGTTNAKRLGECCAAADIELSRKDWYKIHMAAGYMLP